MSEDWISIVEREAEARGMTLQALARKAGLNRAYFRIVRQRPTPFPRGDTLLRISEALGVNITTLLKSGLEEKTSAPRPETQRPERAQPTMTLVPELNVKVGAGGGGVPSLLMENGYESQDETEAFRERWGLPDSYLRNEARVASEAAFIMEVMGDSMIDPTQPMSPGSFLPGDRVIIDTNDRIPSPPGPFVVWDGYSMVLKMVEIIHGTDPVRIRLSSKNPAYLPYEVLIEEANIAGRVRGRITIF